MNASKLSRCEKVMLYRAMAMTQATVASRAGDCCAPHCARSSARARGLPDRAVHFAHALRNTLMPVITIAGLQLGSIIAFAIITETVFQWPGMGLLFIQAVNFADIPVMSAYLVLVAFIFVVINMVVDLLYFVVDPRLSVSGERA